MAWFKPVSLGVGSKRSGNSATTTAHSNSKILDNGEKEGNGMIA